MKKVFMIVLAAAFTFGFTTISCTKDNKNNDDNRLIDDDPNDKPEDNPATGAGSNYYPILMDQAAFDALGSKVVADLRVNDVTSFLYVWDGTYEGGEAPGLNFYGHADGYLSLNVTSVGWSGAGFNIKEGIDNYAKLAEIGAGYYLHFAYKGADGVSQCIIPTWDKEYRITVGNGGEFVDQGTAYPVLAPISNNGTFVPNEWNEYEIAVSEMGLDFTVGGDHNIFCFLTGGVTGTNISLDAIYYYKK